jgi:hypothetical protein
MIRKSRPPSLGASHHLPAWCALLAPKPTTAFPFPLKLSRRPHANHNQTQAFLSSPLLHYIFSKPFA